MYLPVAFQDMASAVFRGTASAGSAAYIRTHCLLCKQGSVAEVKQCAEELCALRHRRPFRSPATSERTTAANQPNNSTPEGIQQ